MDISAGWGSDAPVELLKRYFGYDTFRPGQAEVIEALRVSGRALAVFPTGGGKSICYQLPALALEGVTVVVSPLIALMKDQIDFLRRHGIAAARLDSSLSLQEYQEVSDSVRAGVLKILYVAPERFNNERFLSLLRQVKIALFAIDEAHCISEWGHNFRPDYLKLADTAHNAGAERILALTATATPSVIADISKVFDIPQSGVVVTGFYRKNLNLATTPTRPEERNALLLKRLRSRKPGPTIIYVTLQRTAETVAAYLKSEGFSVSAYHAGMETGERNRVQEWWMQSDANIVVATIAFGMGIDKANVRYVYHYNLPKGLESYSQEIGRAGRDNLRSTVELFATTADVATLENFAYGDMPTQKAVNGMLKELLAGSQEPDGLSVNQLTLANKHDLRSLVLRTALTYLELDGVLKQGTPFYAGYSLRPLFEVEDIVHQFRGEPAQLVASLFATAKRGTSWYRFDADEMAEKLQQPRKRIVRVVEVLEERKLVEVNVSDARQRYTILKPDADIDALTQSLLDRFQKRENQEVQRIQQVLDLVTHAGCQSNALVAYFGEMRTEPCGHCTYCATGQAQVLPDSEENSMPLPAGISVETLVRLRDTHPDALGHPRQMARFLCGLTSPALTRAKLSRDKLFGVWEERRFADVLAWCEQQR